MQIIIVGCGKVGTTLAEELSNEKHNVTVIDLKSETVQTVSNSFDIMGVVGNGASYSTQKEAGVEKADLLIAVTGSDELNLLCCLFAKKAGNCQTIARVRNPIYNKDLQYIREELGLAMIVNPEFAASTEIARLLRFPSAMKIDTFSKGRVEIVRLKVRPEYNINGAKVMDIRNKMKCDVLICGIERGEEVFIPDGNMIIEENDIISIVATPLNLNKFFEKIGIAIHKVKDVMVIGGGKIAYYLAEQLKHMGISIKIIEKNMTRCEELSELLPKATVIHGDGTDKNILLEEGMANTEAFVALTNLDEENIMLALYAKSRSKAKLIAKVNRITFNEVVNDLDIGSIIDPKYITVNNILRYVRGMHNTKGSDNIETLYKILDDRAEALEFNVRENSSIINQSLLSLDIKDNLLICCINRRGKIIIPTGQDMFVPGDSVVVVTTHKGLNGLEDIIR